MSFSDVFVKLHPTVYVVRNGSTFSCKICYLNSFSSALFDIGQVYISNFPVVGNIKHFVVGDSIYLSGTASFDDDVTTVLHTTFTLNIEIVWAVTRIQADTFSETFEIYVYPNPSIDINNITADYLVASSNNIGTIYRALHNPDTTCNISVTTRKNANIINPGDYGLTINRTTDPDTKYRYTLNIDPRDNTAGVYSITFTINYTTVINDTTYTIYRESSSLITLTDTRTFTLLPGPAITLLPHQSISNKVVATFTTSGGTLPSLTSWSVRFYNGNVEITNTNIVSRNASPTILISSGDLSEDVVDIVSAEVTVTFRTADNQIQSRTCYTEIISSTTFSVTVTNRVSTAITFQVTSYLDFIVQQINSYNDNTYKQTFTASTSPRTITIDTGIYGTFFPFIVYTTDESQYKLECMTAAAQTQLSSTSEGVFTYKQDTNQSFTIFTTQGSGVEYRMNTLIMGMPIFEDGNVTVPYSLNLLHDLSLFNGNSHFYFVSVPNNLLNPSKFFSNLVRKTDGVIYSELFMDISNISEQQIAADQVIGTTTNNIVISNDYIFRERTLFNMQLSDALVYGSTPFSVTFDDIISNVPIQSVKLIVIGNDEIKNAKYYIKYNKNWHEILPINLFAYSPNGIYIHNLYLPLNMSPTVLDIDEGRDIYSATLKIEYSGNKSIQISKTRLLIGA